MANYELTYSREYGFHFGDIINRANAHVYLIKIKGLDLYKIGYSTNVDSRINSYKTSSPFEHNYMAIFSSQERNKIDAEYICRLGERALINKYKQYKVRGEWVRLNEDLAMQLMCDLLNLDDDIKEVYYPPANIMIDVKGYYKLGYLQQDNPRFIPMDFEEIKEKIA